MTDFALTAEYLRAQFTYDPETGVFIRARECGTNRVRVGQMAGSRHKDGYISMKIKNRPYGAHRLAWLYVHGEWPKHSIDHINGNRADNRIANLRDVPTSHNCQNRRASQGAGNPYIGVTFHQKVGKWQAQIKRGNKTHYLGLHETAEAAHAAYVVAKRELHPGGML